MHANLLTGGNLLAYYQIIISTSQSGYIIFSPYIFGSVVNVVWFGKVEMGRFRYRQPSPSIAPVDQKSYILSCGSTSFIGATVPCLVITLFYFRMYYVLCIKARSNVHAVTSFLFGTFSLIYGVDLYRDFVW